MASHVAFVFKNFILLGFVLLVSGDIRTTWFPLRDAICAIYSTYSSSCPWLDYAACESHYDDLPSLNQTVAQQVATVLVMPRVLNNTAANLQNVVDISQAILKLYPKYCKLGSTDMTPLQQFIDRTSSCGANQNCASTVSAAYANSSIFSAAAHGASTNTSGCPLIDYVADPAYVGVPNRVVAILTQMGFVSQVLLNSTDWLRCNLTNPMDTVTIDKTFLLQVMGQLTTPESQWILDLGLPSSSRRKLLISVSGIQSSQAYQVYKGVAQEVGNTPANQVTDTNQVIGRAVLGGATAGALYTGNPVAIGTVETLDEVDALTGGKVSEGIGAGVVGTVSAVAKAGANFGNALQSFAAGGNAAIDNIAHGGDSFSATAAGNSAFNQQRSTFSINP